MSASAAGPGPFLLETIGEPNFVSAAGIVAAPGFGAIPPGDDITGVAWGIEAGTGSDSVTMGFTNGNYSGLETHQGGFVENEYYSGSTLDVAFYPENLPSSDDPGVSMAMYMAKNGSADVVNAWIGATRVVQNMPTNSTTFTEMFAGMTSQTTGDTTAFPSFNQPAQIFSLEYYTSSWILWNGNASLNYAPNPPSSQPDAYLTFSQPSGSNTLDAYL